MSLFWYTPVKNTHSNGLIKLLDLSNAFLVEYLLTTISSVLDISTSVLKQKYYITDMCSCYTISWLCQLQKRCTRIAAASDKAYQLLAHGRWFSPGTPASSTTKTGRHDIAEILSKVALKHQRSKSCYTILAFYLCKSLFYSM
jgi:hypothetical protein